MSENEFTLEVVEEVENKSYSPPDLITKASSSADEYLRHFDKILPYYISGGSPSTDTKVSYETAIRLYIKWCFQEGFHPLAAQDPHIRKYRDYLLNKQMFAPATVRLKMTAIKTFYEVAIILKFISANPCENVPLPKIASIKDATFKFFTIEQIREICETFLVQDSLTCSRNTAMVYLMAVEGLRRVEVMRLNDEDIDWQQRIILVRGKTANKPIYPCNETLDALHNYITTRGIVDKEDNGFTPTIINLSNNGFGKRITRQGINWVVDAAEKVAGSKYPGCSCHIFRHSCGTNLYHETRDLRVVQETLRHASPDMTARYAHVHELSEKRYTRNIAPNLLGEKDM